MHPLSFKSKRYALAVFMSTSLSVSSLLSPDARAGSFEALKTKVTKWQEGSKAFDASEAAKELGLYYHDNNKTQRLFNVENLEDKDKKIRHLARTQNAKLEIFKTLLEKPNLEQTIENRIKKNDFIKVKTSEKTTLSDAANDLGINYNHKKLKDTEKQIRHKEKNTKAILEEYIKMLNYAVLDRQVLKWIEEKKADINSKDFEKFAFLKSFDIRQKINFIKSEINGTSNTKDNLLTEIKSQNSNFNISNPSNKVEPTHSYNQNSSEKSATNTPKKKRFDFLKLRTHNNKNEKIKSGAELKNNIKMFQKALDKNPIEALIFAKQKNLFDSLIQEAITKINLNDDSNIKQILTDKLLLDTILVNGSEDQKNEFIKQTTNYAIQNLLTSISDKGVEPEKKLTLATLVASENKKVLEDTILNLLKNEQNKSKWEMDSLLKILLSDEEKLKEKTKEIFKLVVNNQTHNTTLSGPPLPPPSNDNSNILTEISSKYPDLHTLYKKKFIPDSTGNNIAQQNKVETIPTSEGRGNLEGLYTEAYIAYREDTNRKNIVDILHNQKLTRVNDIINVIRQEITSLYSNKHDIEALRKLFTNPNEEISEKAKEIFQHLKSEPYIQNVIVDKGKLTLTEETIIKNLFNENEQEALERLLLKQSSKISEDQIKEIETYQNKLARIETLERTSNFIEKLRYIKENENFFEQTTSDDIVNQLVKNPNKLINIEERVNIILSKDEKLNKILSDTDMDKLKKSTLDKTEIMELAKNNINNKDLLDIIKAKDPKLLKQLFRDKVLIHNPNLANQNDLEAVPTQFKSLLNRFSVEALRSILKDLWIEQNNSKIGSSNNDIPPPPPLLNSTPSQDNTWLSEMGYTQEFINKIPKPTRLNAKVTENSNNANNIRFSNGVAQDFYDSCSKAIGRDMLLSSLEKLEKAIKKEVNKRYAANFNEYVKTHDKYVENEAFDTAYSCFIGPRTKLGTATYEFFYDPQDVLNNVDINFIPRTELEQQIHELYKEEALKLKEDKNFMEYIQNHKDKSELLKVFISQEEIEELVREAEEYKDQEAKPKPQKATAKAMYQETEAEVQEAEATINFREVEPESIISDTEAGVQEIEIETTLAVMEDEEPNPQEVEATINSQEVETESIISDTEAGVQEAEVVEPESEALGIENEAKSKDIEVEEQQESSDELCGGNEEDEQADENITIAIESEPLEEQGEKTKAQFLENTHTLAALLNKVSSKIHEYAHKAFNDRLNVGAVAAGDEDVTIPRGAWVSGLYGVSRQGAWQNVPKYQGRTAGVTIGMDTELNNSSDIIGLAYSRLESRFTYNKKLSKTAVNGHLFSIYGLKELPKSFSLQGIVSFGHNYIKNKTKAINNIIGKYQNNNFNFETLLNYKYQTKYNIHLIPNIGLKYDYSRNSDYKECDNIQNLMIQKKSNQLLTSNLGSKIVFKQIGILNDITLIPSLHGNIESHFYNKDTKVNAKAILKDEVIEEKIILSKQPKFGYNIGGNVLLNRKNINVLLEYNYYTHKKYQSHQGLAKLKVNL